MNEHKPFVTVLMPVFNGEKYLNEAIESILNQTYTNFEFLIINDGSTDSTEDIILSYTDSRIRYIKNETNIQLIASLNKGIQLSNGKYIARMDADDMSLPHRLEKQVQFMEANTEVGICGSWVQKFGQRNEIVRYPETHDEISVSLLFYSSISHPASIWRTELFRKYSLIFKSDYLYAEDYKLWADAFRIMRLYNIQEILLKYRLHPNQMGETSININSTKCIKRELLGYLNINFTPEEKLEIDNVLRNNPMNLKQAIQIIAKICNSNQKLKLYNQSILERKFVNLWKNYFLEYTPLSLSDYWLFCTQSISKKVNFTAKQKLAVLRKIFQ